MSHPLRRNVADKVAVQLIEADVETGFALVDEIRACFASGQPQFSLRLRQDAEDILADIERRLERLGESEAGPFLALVTELRKELTALERNSSE